MHFCSAPLGFPLFRATLEARARPPRRNLCCARGRGSSNAPRHPRPSARPSAGWRRDGPAPRERCEKKRRRPRRRLPDFSDSSPTSNNAQLPQLQIVFSFHVFKNSLFQEVHAVHQEPDSDPERQVISRTAPRARSADCT